MYFGEIIIITLKNLYNFFTIFAKCIFRSLLTILISLFFFGVCLEKCFAIGYHASCDCNFKDVVVHQKPGVITFVSFIHTNA